jgi:hypothetical protein
VTKTDRNWPMVDRNEKMRHHVTHFERNAFCGAIDADRGGAATRRSGRWPVHPNFVGAGCVTDSVRTDSSHRTVIVRLCSHFLCLRGKLRC